MSIKIADLTAGEHPSITADTDESNQKLKDRRDEIDLDAKLYSTVLDLSRYGDSVWRLYADPESPNNDQRTFTLWDPREWFPIVSQDGTNTITHHVLAWKVRIPRPGIGMYDYFIHVQIHGTRKNDIGYYEERVYKCGVSDGAIGKLISSTKYQTGFNTCAVMHVRALERSDTVYGDDDYMPIDSLLAEILARLGQISIILDKHANPNITGPTSMLETDQETGEKYLRPGSFYGVSPGEEQPKYMTWDGQLTAAFKELEILINQLYILTEMGSAMLGAQDAGSQAISGTAMRFKMVNPVAKARRIANSLTRQVRQLMGQLTDIDYKKISIFWYDGLPDDPRENIENATLATGETHLMPLKDAIMEFFARSPDEANRWIDALEARAEAFQPSVEAQSQPKGPGGVEPRTPTTGPTAPRGSETGLTQPS
jgi:hypothetical protein